MIDNSSLSILELQKLMDMTSFIADKKRGRLKPTPFELNLNLKTLELVHCVVFTWRF